MSDLGSPLYFLAVTKSILALVSLYIELARCFYLAHPRLGSHTAEELLCQAEAREPLPSVDPALGTPTPSCLQGEKAGTALDATAAAGCAWRPSRLRFPQFSAGHFPPHPGGLPGGQGWVRLSQPACSSLTPSHHGVYCPIPHTPPLLTPACLQPFELPQHNRSLYSLPPPYPRPAPRPAGFASLWQVPPIHPQGPLLSP